MNLSSVKEKIKKLPATPGVYLFRDKNGRILYIGKAASLKSRVSSYFIGPHDTKTEKMIEQIAKIDYQKTDSVLEALILEANLVKKYQPKYNMRLKDDKSFCYFVITKEEFPRVLIVRKTDLKEIPLFPPLKKRERRKISPFVKGGWEGDFKKEDKGGVSKFYGPYTSKKQMEVALNIMRKIFPFHSLAPKTEKGCLDFQIGRCPGPYAGAISQKDYQKNIRGIQMILEGKKKNLIKKLEKEMAGYSQNQEFEKAAELRNKIFALRHIQDIALISKSDLGNLVSNLETKFPRRIEAYDISNIFGQFATGSMIVFTDGQIDKSQYRKFKIKSVAGINDVAMMKEVLRRRLRHQKWPLPDLIFIDGGAGQFNGAVRILEERGLKIPIVALAKGPNRKGEKLFTSKPLDIKINFIKEISDEAHRFAVSYHRLLRKKELLSKWY